MSHRDRSQSPLSSPSSRTSSDPAHQVTQHSSPPQREPWPWEVEERERGLDSFLAPFANQVDPRLVWSAKDLFPEPWMEAAKAFHSNEFPNLDWLKNQPLCLGRGESGWLLPLPDLSGENRLVLLNAKVPPCPGDQLLLSLTTDEHVPVMAVAVMWPAIRVPKDEFDDIAPGAFYWGAGPYVVMGGRQSLAEVVTSVPEPTTTLPEESVELPPLPDMD